MEDFININNVQLRFKSLTQNYQFLDFDCGNGDLNDFLIHDAKINLKYLRYTTTVLETENKIVAYYSLANDLLTIRDIEDFRSEIDSKVDVELAYWERFYNQVNYPAVKIGRLAVDKEFQGKGIGKFILYSLCRSFSTNNKAGCQFITVDAINDHNEQRTIKFYESNGFKLLTLSDVQNDSRAMYKPLINGLI
jgi:GNAT superfamily N-acetyltransferase